MLINHLKMTTGTVGLVILVIAGLMIRVTETDKASFSHMWDNLLDLWEDMKTDVYGSN
jgi:hypothetical protein